MVTAYEFNPNSAGILALPGKNDNAISTGST